MKKNFIFFTCLVLLSMLMLSTSFSLNILSINAQESSGLDFINEAPLETTEYVAGEGKVIYQPQENGDTIITLHNAMLNADKEVKYWTNSVYSAIAAKGNIKLILEGNNKVYLKPNSSSVGLLFYDSNVTIEGNGSLYIGFEDSNHRYFNAQPIDIMGNYDILNGNEEGNFLDSGNLFFKSGTIEIEAQGSSGQGALTVHNLISIEDGIINTKGRTNGIYSVYDDIKITGGEINCKDYTMYGLYSRRGNIIIDGENSKINLEGLKDMGTVGMSAGDMSYNKTELDEAGYIEINNGVINIKSDFIGLFSQQIKSVTNSGKILINGGVININCVGEQEKDYLIAGIYVQGEIIEENSTTSEGDFIFKGGLLSLNIENISDGLVVGIHTDGKLELNGGEIKVSAKGLEESETYALNANNGIYISNTKAELASSKMIMNSIPFMSENIKISASTNINGENLENFDTNKLEFYKYFKIDINNKPEKNIVIPIVIALGVSIFLVSTILITYFLIRRNKLKKYKE